MRIIDLDPAHEASFNVCLEEGSPEANEAGPRRRCWVQRFRERGLRAKLAIDDHDRTIGMIQYLPIEQSFVDGHGLYLILCIWVPDDHAHPDGQGHGVGTALLASAEADAFARGARGMAAWGMCLPVWMRASWFKKHGYRDCDRQGLLALLWKPFVAGAEAPRWIPTGRDLPTAVPGKVNVTCFTSGWCMAGNLTTERARRAAAELGDRVRFQEIDTSEHDAVQRWGHVDALFVDGEMVGHGRPPTLVQIRRHIEHRLAALST